MGVPPEAFEPDTRVIDLFVKWIEQFDRRHARFWAHRYKDDPEAAMCEAMYWEILTDCGVEVKPNADLDGGKPAPDFVCYKDGCRFYVEVTCIRIETATNGTGLSPTVDLENRASSYAPLNQAIFNECRSKTPQCSGLDAPCILAVGTFHLQASVLCIKKAFMEWLLTSEPKIAYYVDLGRGKPSNETWQETDLRRSVFDRPGKLEGIESVRQPISGLLVAGLGCRPPSLYGLIHRNPVHTFNPSLLPRIPFCHMKVDVINGTISTEWNNIVDD